MICVPLGVGDAFSERHYSTSFAVLSDGVDLLIDCPHPMRRMLHAADLSARRFAGVILTHLHGDHVSGLESFAFFNYFVLKQRLKIIACPAVLDALWPRHLAVSMERLRRADGAWVQMRFEDYFEPIALQPGARYALNGLEIELRETIHHIPTTAVKIYEQGRCLGYSADTTFDLSLIEWLSEANLIFHETNYGTHTAYQSLKGLDASLRARMRLVHYPDDFAHEGEILTAKAGQRDVV
ncbi:MBL fold metallo-hydrolase [Myxococcota bacterium]|nr:MBL fold metallo-hydrolase [Myxococcota bacterium]MBU1432484.1 MBL fold metallo-hydrolase [Myxococcota bacterium]MBU1899644.1 MBL fold metallo-hydrolase [Myxococcota bacterium]